MSAAGKPGRLQSAGSVSVEPKAEDARPMRPLLKLKAMDPLCWVLFVAGALAMMISCLLVGHDQYMSQNLRQAHVPGDVRKAVELSEAFAHGSGATMILLAIFAASSRRAGVWIAVATTASSGVVANVMKAFFTRARPYTYDQVTAVPHDVTGWEFLGSGSFWDASHRSFPSGHTATAWGLAIGLSTIYPRGTLVFMALAATATFQRLYSGAHFVSDVCAGFAVACWCCALVLSLPLFRRLRDGMRLQADGN